MSRSQEPIRIIHTLISYFGEKISVAAIKPGPNKVAVPV
jgi:hypothetical protein